MISEDELQIHRITDAQKLPSNMSMPLMRSQVADVLEKAVHNNPLAVFRSVFLEMREVDDFSANRGKPGLIFNFISLFITS